MSGWRGPVLLAGLFAGFFALYQLSLTLHARAYPPPRPPGVLYAFFGADNMTRVLREPQPRGGLSIHAVKHPLFAELMPPLHELGTLLYAGLPEQPARQLATAFPFAFLGAANVCLAFWILLRNQPSRATALMFALIYGLSASSWFFSSFPETYVLTSLCSNLFFAALLGRAPLSRRLPWLAWFNALACYAAPHQLILGLVPCLRHLVAERRLRRSLPGVLIYALLLGVIFVLPYQLWLARLELRWTSYLAHMAAIERLWDLRRGAVTLLNFFVFPLIGPVAEPRLYGERSLAILGRLSWLWALGATCYLLCAARGLANARGSQAPWMAFAPGVALLLAGYSLFFWCFNPRESFIYSLPLLLPWLLLVQSGYDARIGRAWHCALLLLIGCMALNNAQLMLLLRELAPPE